MRTFVFITEIPDFLLQPLQGSSAAAQTSGRGARDPRYERLRRLLADHSSGVMLVMHLETRGYALALYASEEEALDACRTHITPEQPDQTYPPLKMRIVAKEKPLPPETVYTPTMTIEGKVVAKSDLADTRGLELVYRGRSVAKWCPRTLEGLDCHFGVACHRIHCAAYQQTVRKRPRFAFAEGLEQLSREELSRVAALTTCTKNVESSSLIPGELRFLPSVHVPISSSEARTLFGEDSGGAKTTLLTTLSARLETACRSNGVHVSSTSPIFLRMSFSGGSPWDWSLSSPEGVAQLQQRCPLPANGAPTPLERDLFSQRLFFHLNALNASASMDGAVHTLSCSGRVRTAFKRHLEVTKEEVPLYMVVRPWLYLPTVGCEVTAFVARTGRWVQGCVQRYGQLRLMISVAQLRTTDPVAVNQRLDTYTVPGSDVNQEAERVLQNELQQHSKLFGRAVAQLQGSVAQAADVPTNSAWCFRLAVVVSRPTENPEATAVPRVVVLSLKPYQEALEECALYVQLEASDGEGQRSSKAVAVDVAWNTQKHQYIALFSREEMEKLRVSSRS